MSKINVTVWNEFHHEKTSDTVKAIYPNGMHETIKTFLAKNDDMNVTTATQDMPEHGLTHDVLNNTDVLIWWGHMLHGEVSDEIVNRVYDRVQNGMGLIVLHSGHASKIFAKLMGTNTWELPWRERNEKSLVWAVEQNHPIAKGVNRYVALEHEEMYGEGYFYIPKPEEVVFISWFEGGEVFRSGCTYTRGNGKIFYFQPGHETYPTYHNEGIQKIITNAVRWAKSDIVEHIHGYFEPVMKIGE
jgi:trehalose utilization protein